jgi:hypothetical protein
MAPEALSRTSATYEQDEVMIILRLVPAGEGRVMIWRIDVDFTGPPA